MHDFAYVEAPAYEVRQRLVGDPVALVAAALQGVEREVTGMLATVGLGAHHSGFGKQVRVEVGIARAHGDVLVLPITWEATTLHALFPRMEADVEVAAFGAGRTQITFLGTYEPPLGALGASLDTVALHRVAEATVRSVLRRIADQLSVPVGTCDGEGVPDGPGGPGGRSRRSRSRPAVRTHAAT